MVETVKSPMALRSALQRLARQRLDSAVVVAQREAAAYCYTQWIGGKFTWSRFQPHDVWSGQTRMSVTVSIGQIDPKYAPANPGPWPIHTAPYAPPDPFTARFILESLTPYSMVYVSDSAPQAGAVEAHTHIAHMAAQFTISHFRGYSWRPLLSQQGVTDAPF